MDQRLRRLWWLAVAIGIAAFGCALLWVVSPGGPGFDWIWALAAFGVGVIACNLAFFALCSMFVPSLGDMVEDETRVEGNDVVHVVHHPETGDAVTDFYIRAYATARGVSVSAIGAGVLIALALWFF